MKKAGDYQSIQDPTTTNTTSQSSMYGKTEMKNPNSGRHNSRCEHTQSITLLLQNPIQRSQKYGADNQNEERGKPSMDSINSLESAGFNDKYIILSGKMQIDVDPL